MAKRARRKLHSIRGAVHRASAPVAAWLVVAAAAAGACSASEGGTASQLGAGGSATAGSGGSGALGAVGGQGGSGVGGGVGGSVINADSGQGGAPPQCGGQAYEADPKPLDMYIMEDKSGSMVFPNAAWVPVIAALRNFVKSPEAGGIGVGLGFFDVACSGNLPDCDNESSCVVADYAKATVPIGLLPAHGAALDGALAAAQANGGTPMGPALQGAIDYAKSHATANPDHKVIVVLATDGQPDECPPKDVPGVAQIAAAGLSGTPSIVTYVIGVGFTQQNLVQIAQAGGGEAFVLNTGPGVEQAFLDAMNKIRGAAIPCDFSIPVPTSGQFDPGQVNVDFTDSAGLTTRLPYVVSADKCVSGQGGWYYDNPQAPSRILICAEACSAWKTIKAKVDIVLGCPTEGPK